MREWKLRQKIYHRALGSDLPDIIELNSDMSNHLDIKQYADVGDLIAEIVSHFTIEVPRLVYPAKSFYVAIMYARLLEQNFGQNFYTVLDDPELLYGNDQFFVPYSKARYVYDEVLKRIDLTQLNMSLSQVKSTVGFFRREFLIDN